MALDTSLIQMAESIDDCQLLSDRNKRIILAGNKSFATTRKNREKLDPDISREAERSLSRDS